MKIAFNPSTVAALTSPPDNKDITFDLRGQNIFARGVKFLGTDTNTWRDIKINNVSIGSYTLDLRNGSNTTLTNTNGVVTINSTWRPVVDNLTSDSTTSSLSANLGRVLAGLINGKSDSEHTHDDRYLRLTGGWMSGDINFGDDNKIYWGRNTDSASISFKNDGDGDADSYMSFVTSDNGNEYFRWSHSSGSTNTEWMALRSDGLRVGGTKVSLEGHSHNDLYYTKTEVNNKLNDKSDTSHTHDDRYLKLTGGTMLLGKGLKFHSNDNYFGTYADARIISLLDSNDKICDGGLIIDERATLDGKEYVTELLRIRDSEFKWKGADILHSGNYSGILDSRYYTESEVNSLLDAKLNRQNLSYGNWNPRGWNLAADYHYNGGDLSISENNGKMYISVDGCFWLNEGQYRVLDTSDISDIRDSVTLHQYLGATDVAWYPLVWGGASHNNTSDSTGPIYKSYDKLSWQTSSLTLYATHLRTTDLNTLTALFHPDDDSTLKIYSGRTLDAVSDGHIGLLTSIDGTDGLTHVYPTLYGSRCVLALLPRGGSVYIGNMPNGGNGRKLNVNGDIGLLNTGSIRDLAIGGGIYWNPYVESASDGSDAASITLVRLGVAGGTTLVLSLMNDANDTILFQTNGSARLYHNSYPILTTLNTYVSNNKGYINNTEVTLVNNADTVDGYHASGLFRDLGWWDENETHDANDITGNGALFAYRNHSNVPTWGVLVTFRGGSDEYRWQMAKSYGNRTLYIRQRNGDNGTWSNWLRLLDENDLTWNNIAGKPSTFNPAAHTHTVFNNNLMIKGTNGVSDSASIHLGIGDSDTGFKWISDGVCQIYANNVAVGEWTPGGMNWFKNPTVNGNKVWNAGNDGSGSGLDADTLDGYHETKFFRHRGNTNKNESPLKYTGGTLEYYGNLPSGMNNVYTWGGSLVSGGEITSLQFYYPDPANDKSIYARTFWDNNDSGWHKLAFTDSKVADSDKLDGIHANGLLTALSNTNNGISVTVGGTTKSVANISVNYASSSGNADTVDDYHATSGRTFDGNINWSPNWNDTWSDGTNSHPWYGFDHRYPNTGAYSTTISDYFGMTIKTYNTLRLDCRDLLINGTNISNLNVASATNAYHLRINSANTWSTWYWAGLSGLPSWLWGSNDGTNMYVWNPSNFRVAYASSAGNAETLGGMPKNYGQAPFGTIPCVGGDGVMEIGRYIDYHYDNSGNYDFSTRLLASGNNRNVVTLPSASGTLALVSQVLTWKSLIIDMRSYSESYWHPVTVLLPYTGYNKIKVSVLLNSGDKPSWATHNDGITCNMEIWATASGWGTTDSDTICLNYTYKFCSQNPCGWMQLGNPSLGVLFLRGGSRYIVYTDFDATFTPHDKTYTWIDGSYSLSTGGPHTSCPGLNFNMGAIRADLIATMVQARRVCAGHDPGIDNSISCSNWFRSSGNTGWYNTTYLGGWYMSDTSWIRAHNGVGIYTSGQIYSPSSIRMGNILLEHTDEINNITNGGIHLNYRNSGNVSLCYGGGNVSIGYSSPSYKLDVNGLMRADGFHHGSVNSDNYMLLAGGGYKSFGGDDSTPIFLGYLNLDHGNDGTVSSSFSCLGYSVPFTYTRGGNYCRISIPDTTHQVFYIKAAIASVHYSGGGMDTWVGDHRSAGAWWLHCYASGVNEVRVKGFRNANGNNDSWWGGNPLYSGNDGANKITVCIFGYVKFR